MSRIGLLSLLIVDNDNLRLVKRILNKNAIRICGSYLANKTQKCLASCTSIWYVDSDVHMQLDKACMTTGTNGGYALTLIVTYGGKFVHIMQYAGHFTVYFSKKYAYDSDERYLLNVVDQTQTPKTFADPFEAVNYMMWLE